MVNDLLRCLASATAGKAILDLPPALQNGHILADADDRGLVEFGASENPFVWQAIPLLKLAPFPQAIPLLPFHVRLTPAGRIRARELAVQPAADAAEPSTKTERRSEWLAKAMLLVRDHPKWSDRTIAKRVRKNASSLTRSREYQAAAALARGGKDQLVRGFLRRDADGGRTVEARTDD
jgi:hypothetical protein